MTTAPHQLDLAPSRDAVGIGSDALVRTEFPMTIEKPEWWFRATCEADEIKIEPQAIEYLRMWTGETFVHTGGTAYWDAKNNRLDHHALTLAGITHWRIRPLS